MGGKEPMTATSFAFSTADCEKMEASKESEEEPEKASCDGLDCAGCLAVPDYGCGFADGACYEAGKEPMTATSFAFSTADCEKMEASKESEEEPEKASCDGLDCLACLAVPDYGCGFADGACYTAGKEPMTATSFAFSTDDCPKEEDHDHDHDHSGEDHSHKEEDIDHEHHDHDHHGEDGGCFDDDVCAAN